jgi:hypothetical protein
MLKKPQRGEMNGGEAVVVVVIIIIIIMLFYLCSGLSWS